jgi:tetratricopeptide (TPR) repeat protein
MSRQYDDAIKQFRKTLLIDKSFAAAYYWTSLSYLQKGLYDKTIEEYQNFLLGDTIYEKYVPIIDSIFKKSGIEGFLKWLIDEGIGLGNGIYNQPYHLAVCYTLLNNKDLAFKYLGEASEQHVSWVSFSKVDPGFDNLHEDPRFSIFLEKLGL